LLTEARKYQRKGGLLK